MTLRRLAPVLFALCILVPHASLAATEEVINDFSVRAAITADGRTSFREDIAYDFGPIERHGIYRLIPVDYRRYGSRYELDLSVSQVSRDGAAEPYQISSVRDGSGSNVMSVRIGRTDTTWGGAHTYGLTYATSRAMNFFNDHDELYWNVTGNGWDVSIEQASFYLTLPSGVPAESVSTTCYTGPVGLTERACTANVIDGIVEFHATRVLGPREGLTVVIGVPKGFIHEPSQFERFKMLLIDNRSLFFPLIALVIMLWLWRTKGRDPKLETIIPQYESPDGLAPAIIQAIWSYGNAGDRGITATIIDLAQRGYLHIAIAGDEGAHVKAKDFTLLKKKEADDQLSAVEWVLFKGLFTGRTQVTLAELREGKFYTTVAAFKKSVHDGLDEMKVFEKDPSKVRGRYILAGALIAFAPIFFSGRIAAIDTAAAVVTSIIVIGIGWHMPRRTVPGTRLEERIEGFKWFLSVTEKDRMAFHDAPEKRPEQFSQFLAYAVVFGIEEKWAAQFAGMDVPPPEWAEGRMRGMNTIMFASAMSSFHEGAHGMYAAPSSAGGGGSGFSGGGSGGGFGGGGGGSW